MIMDNKLKDGVKKHEEYLNSLSEIFKKVLDDAEKNLSKIRAKNEGKNK